MIEDACLGDAAAIAGVHIAGLRTAYRGAVPDDVLAPPDLGPRVRIWEQWLARSQAVTVVARVDDVVVGFCALQTVAGEGEIPFLFVLSSHWRRGLGRRLGERVLVEACARGFEEVVLWVLESNERARSFYAALGFRPDGTTRVFIERANVTLHELRYRRSTSPAGSDAGSHPPRAG